MDHYTVLERIGAVPRAGDPERARHGRARWLDATAGADGLGPVARSLDRDPRFGPLADAVFGNSPFLTRCLVGQPDILVAAVRDGPLAVVERAIGGLESADRDDRLGLMRRLRQARGRVAAAVALADVAGLWTLDEVTESLSRFADAAVGATVRHLLRAEAAAGRIELATDDDVARGSGLIVLALGKLGAHELNYSSDIDIMVLYDGEVVRCVGAGHPQAVFVRLTRELVRILQERTADGSVVRVDLRLRPDPAATPLALSVDAALLYYESLGQNWERAALIKARAMAGDIEAGTRFLRGLTPFVWRKHLDFAAIQDIHSIKRQIAAHRGGARIAVAGHNIKLGRGGIREIEFYAQTQQLIWGGRDPSLRARATCAALRSLAAAGHADERAVEELTAAYGFLRRLEHRLQMVDDQQTQTLPSSSEKLDAIATFLGFASVADFSEALSRHLATVERRYAALFEEAPDLAQASGNLVFTGTEDDPGTIATLCAMGFGNAPAVAAAIRGWHHGRYRAMRSTRARELLTEITPTLLAALVGTADPDTALTRFDEFLRALPAGVQLFSLFYSRPRLLDLVAAIMGTAPRLAELLSHNPILLDSVLTEAFEAPLPAADAMTEALSAVLDRARDEQDVLDLARRWAHDRQFQVGIQMLRRIVAPEAAHAMLADLAEAVVRALLPRVETIFTAQHGRIPGSGLAVLALGKLGGREMTATSDLDLVFVYEAPAGVDLSDGPKPLAPSVYFTRLSQRLLNALSALTAEGRLYEIDMRLRPSGTKGPVASELDGFLRYQRAEAWVWEHMALTRARVLSAPEGLKARLEAGVRSVLAEPRDPAALAAEVVAMRARIAAEHGTDDPWDVKRARGGLIDIEFIAQYVLLRDAARHPEILAPGTAELLERCARAGCLASDDAEALVRASRLQGRVQGLARLTLTHRLPGDAIPRALQDLMAAVTETTDLTDLRHALLAAQADVRARFARIVESPANKCVDIRFTSS